MYVLDKRYVRITVDEVHMRDMSTRLLWRSTVYQLENNGEVPKNFVS
jgi:hypothetical protein